MQGSWEMSLNPESTTLVCDLGQITYSFGASVSSSVKRANNRAS